MAIILLEPDRLRWKRFAFHANDVNQCLGSGSFSPVADAGCDEDAGEEVLGEFFISSCDTEIVLEAGP